MEALARNVGVGNTDGALLFSGLVNDVMTSFFEINGGENEINAFKPIDMVGNNIRSSTGSMTLTTALSTGLGIITLAPKATTGSVIIQSAVEPTTDFIRINPQTTTNAQQVLMTATDVGTGFVNSINLLNLNNHPYIELKADFGGGAINKSIQIDCDGTGSSNNKITAYDGQNNLPFQIISNGITDGSIEFIPKDTTGDLIFTGTNIESASAGSNSGQHLRIKLNGVYYKIALLND
jgi:hypothetical protein